MVDNLSKKKRSYVMSQIKSKWTKPEVTVHNYLKGGKIRHRMHPKMTGNPDIVLKDMKVVIFLDGCFWHGCSKCYKSPTSNVVYWKKKIIINKKNAQRANSMLRKDGWKVVRIWEHDLEKTKTIMESKLGKLKSRIKTL